MTDTVFLSGIFVKVQSLFSPVKFRKMEVILSTYYRPNIDLGSRCFSLSCLIKYIVSGGRGGKLRQCLS